MTSWIKLFLATLIVLVLVLAGVEFLLITLTEGGY